MYAIEAVLFEKPDDDSEHGKIIESLSALLDEAKEISDASGEFLELGGIGLGSLSDACMRAGACKPANGKSTGGRGRIIYVGDCDDQSISLVIESSFCECDECLSLACEAISGAGFAMKAEDIANGRFINTDKEGEWFPYRFCAFEHGSGSYESFEDEEEFREYIADALEIGSYDGPIHGITIEDEFGNDIDLYRYAESESQLELLESD